MTVSRIVTSIRLGGIADAHRLGRLHVRAWQYAYAGIVSDAHLVSLNADERAARFAQYLSVLPSRVSFWVIESEGKVVGFCDDGPSIDEDATERVGSVYALYLDPSVWRCGFGARLLGHAEDDLRMKGFTEATLWALATNAAADVFYRALGWEPDGTAHHAERPYGTLHMVRHHKDLS